MIGRSVALQSYLPEFKNSANQSGSTGFVR